MLSQPAAHAPPPTRQGLFSLWLVLFAVWMLANATLALAVAATGAIITFALAALTTSRSEAWRQIRWSPAAAYHFAAYTLVFSAELIKANINMLSYVYSPSLAIRPGIVRVRTRLRSPIGRLALANSIALTPGSLVLELDEETLLIHWLDIRSTDVEVATQALAGPFERHLEKVFG